MSELRRRNVFRMAVLYVVAAWLIMQVAEVVIGLANLPEWVGPAILVLLAIGFPIALIFSWFYELTAEGISLEKDVDLAESITRVAGRRLDFVVISLLCAAVLMFAYDKWSTPDHPVITEYRKLTDSKVLLPPVPSILPLVVDKSRIYFTDFSDGDYGIRQVPKTGGDAVRFDLPRRRLDFIGIPTDMTPDGNALLLSGHDEDPVVWGTDSLWTIPTVGGSLRRIGEGRAGVYSPNGKKIAFLQGDDRLFVANSDMSDPKQIATLPGRGYAPAFSPDGSRIRLSVFKGSLALNLWEVPVEGGEPEHILSDWQADSICCGSWTPDGKYFVFEARNDIRSQIWAVKDVDGAERFQLTTGAIDYIRPRLSADGRTIFATGWQLRGEIMEFDPEAETYRKVPGLEGKSVDQVDYSPDGLRVAYIKYPELTLWSKSVGGNNASQLTFYPMVAAGPSWSPDGESIAFTGWIPGEPRSIYTVNADGGELGLISNPEAYSWSPTWSPHGDKLMFSEAGSDRPKIVDLVIRSTQTLAGDGRFSSPSWAPSGLLVAGRSGNSLMLYDFQSGQTRVLAEDKTYDTWYWSGDSRSLYVVDGWPWDSRRSVYRIDLDDGAADKIWQVGNEIGAFGSAGRWIGVTADGNILMLRNHSIHNIYALDWNPE